jgi:RNA 3'-terminal phosphate cyclase
MAPAPRHDHDVRRPPRSGPRPRPGRRWSASGTARATRSSAGLASTRSSGVRKREGSPALLTLDGSHGEGGGQILRVALALAVATRRPIRLVRIRAGRPRPGLQPQHLAVVRALTAVSGACVSGDALGSTELTFEPRRLEGGSYRLDIGAVRASAGSVSLAYEALLLALLRAPVPSTLTLIGGTEVPWSPPVQYLTEVFVPEVHALGLDTAVRYRGWPDSFSMCGSSSSPAPRGESA